jgi:cytochrome c-type biogenesis protein
MESSIGPGIAFLAGLSGFFSPCVLPMAPVYLASLAGPGVFDSGNKKIRLPVFFHSLAFVAAFSLVFSLWGAGAGLIGSALASHLAAIRFVVGALLVVFGIVMLASLKVPWLNFEKRLAPSLSRTGGYLRSFLSGGLFCLAWTPCLSFQLTAILGLAGSSGSVAHGTLLLFIYSLGLGLPFLVLGMAFGFISPLLKNVSKYSNIIYIVSGILLIAVGILILAGRMSWLLGALQS